MSAENKKKPRHVAVVMDGNGRWAEQRGLPRVAGHEQGVKSVENIIRAAAEHKIEILTLFAFGIENWGRPSEEVDFLMQLFVKNLHHQAEQFIKNNIRLRVIGERSRLTSEVCLKIDEIQAQTQNNTGLMVVIAFNYSGRWDIVQAARVLAESVAHGQLTLDQIDSESFGRALCLGDLPEPDLLIRTSGEQRLSNFMLWQFAYTELYFTDTLWPDFNANCFEKALEVFGTRQRRYGLTGNQVPRLGGL